jgi:hypothetical protein
MAIHLRDGTAAGARLASELGLGIVVWEDVDGAAATRFGTEGTPATAVIDPGGACAIS